ncbi:hypothetical protein [Metabacillus indicus]|uniref:Lipoprotein YvcA n=1 Tax=Metabacillus indicus TaxID=246786 RepID=A0A084GNP6_METID|nr:hypothetical protein [Metabacillus indicus]KEZ48958.1 hypothetical protein GS18_0216205 [Metabacillus indicus]
MIKQFIKLNLAFMLTLTAGCGTDSAGKAEKQEFTPETKAFKDDFTREFIKSPDETEDGYYTFVSKTKGYTMLFPVNATISSAAHDYQEDYFETYNFGESVDEENLSRYFTVTYEDKPSTRDIEFNLELLTEHTGYESEFKEIRALDNVIYYGKGNKELTHNETGKKVMFYGYFGYIQSPKDHKGLHFFYQTTCRKADKPCEVNEQVEEERALLMMKSIQF